MTQMTTPSMTTQTGSPTCYADHKESADFKVKRVHRAYKALKGYVGLLAQMPIPHRSPLTSVLMMPSEAPWLKI